MPEPDLEKPARSDAQEADWKAREGERLLVVGIGASAGGLEAFEGFLRRTVADSGLAYVFVQHLDPEHESLLAELLGRATALPVEFANDGQRVERNHVYVMPRGAGLLLDGGRLRLVPPGPRGSQKTIDAFLTSLAEDQRENAVGIVLSGTGSDGALGIGTVKQHGGATLAQLPSEARYRSMPEAAIATGMVEQILPTEEMPAALASLAEERRRHPPESARGEAEGLQKALEILHQRTGHDFSGYKRSTLLRRVHRRMVATGAASVRDYADLIERQEEEIKRLGDDLMINVTSFFRDGEPFRTLERLVVPDILERRPQDGARVWVAGCSSGEEAYSLAMLFREQTERMQRPPRVQIFATDIDLSALAEARRGRYGRAVEQEVGPERLVRFFAGRDDVYVITKDLRDLCIFTEHDVIRDPPFSRLDLVSCRNLLIYLEPAMQRRVVELAHYALRPGGYLLLGKAETIDADDLELFDLVEKNDRLYRRREAERRRGFPSFPGRAGRTQPLEMAPLGRPGGPAVRSAKDRSRNLVLEEYAPPAVVVDGRGEVRYYWGTNLGFYLPPQAGPPARDLLNLVRKELKVDLGAALHNAARQKRTVTYQHLLVVEGVERRLELVVRPLPPANDDLDELFLVVFQELPQPGAVADGAPLDLPTTHRYRQLELDLQQTRERLQSTVDELENANEALRSSNEELQSMNEEMHSTNEELQTSQEELQSVNEELNTVNAELGKKVDELEVLYGDLQNLFQSTEIATVFVNLELRIARFTPAASTVFGLAEGDAGRPLSDFAARFDAQGVPEEVRRVLQTMEPVERTVRTVEQGRWFLMRMHPYRTPSNAIAGVVISFVDVTKLKDIEAALQQAVGERERAEQALREANMRKDEFLAVLSHELRNPLAPIRNCLHLLEHSPAGSEASRRAQQVITRQVGHLTRLVDDLLDVTRIARGKVQLQRQGVDLRELIERTAEDYRALFTERGVAFKTDRPAGALWVDGDATRLAQVVGNLLQNAAKFTPARGTVVLSLRAVGDRAELRFRDTGIGIDPLLLPRLFQPFSQGDATAGRSEGGLGLGLALVKGLVELHGGTVEVRSSGKGGTEFVVRLPIIPAPTSPLAREVVPPPAPGPHRILLIEDNVDGAETLREVLELDGHTVAVAHDGPGGLEQGRSFGPDVVLCDIGLPGMDGYAVAQAVRRDAALRGAFLIALTGYALPEDQRRASDAGFDAHLAKPPSVEQIREAIARAPPPRRTPP